MANKAKTGSIPDTDEAWESGQLGRDDRFVAVCEDSPEIEMAINEAAGLQAISIRLEKSLIEDFKALAALNGLGYQTLMRQCLKRFSDAEKRRLLLDQAAEVSTRKRAKRKVA